MKRMVSSESGRADKVLALMLDESRSQVSKLIKSGFVSVNGTKITKGSVIVESGDNIEYEIPKVTKSEAKEIDFDIEILYEDDDLLIIDKPAGLVVHPAPSLNEPTLVDWLVKRGISLSTLAGEERHGIVHRIDRGTSGALAIAKNNRSHRELAKQLKTKEMGRYYLAVIDHPLKNDITVNKPIARNPNNRLKMAVVEGGREAKTDFIKIAESTDGRYELIAARLHTGRTHQIRVHLSSVGRHILGDELYGCRNGPDISPRVFLHAFIMKLRHPADGKVLRITAPLPNDITEFIENKFERGKIDDINIEKTILDAFDSDSITN